MSKYANDLDMMSQALRGELNDCKCCAYGSHECACDAVWPEDVAREAADEIERLRGELAACQADAARYRYLRHASRRECLDKNGPEAGCWIDCEDENHMLILLTEEDADNAIDAAMAKVEDV